MNGINIYDKVFQNNKLWEVNVDVKTSLFEKITNIVNVLMLNIGALTLTAYGLNYMAIGSTLLMASSALFVTSVVLSALKLLSILFTAPNSIWPVKKMVFDDILAGGKIWPSSRKNYSGLRNHTLEKGYFSVNNHKCSAAVIRTHKKSKKWVIYIHGVLASAENKADNQLDLDQFTDLYRDHNVLIISRPLVTFMGLMTNYYNSSTAYSTVLAALKYVQQYDADELRIHGHSMGGGLVAQALKNLPAEMMQWLQSRTEKPTVFFDRTYKTLSSVLSLALGRLIGNIVWVTGYNYKPSEVVNSRINDIFNIVIMNGDRDDVIPREVGLTENEHPQSYEYVPEGWRI